jgi:sugar phosphate isomerase/epimerase
MHICLNQSCFPGVSIEQFTEIVSRAGVSSVELRVIDRFETPREIAAAIRATGLRVESICGLMDWALPDDLDPHAALERLLAVADVCAAPLIVCVSPLRHSPLPPSSVLIQPVAERLSALAAIARAAGVRLAFEQVGRSSTRLNVYSGIRHLRDALAVVEMAAEDTVLTLDSYNIATADDDFDDIRTLPLSRVGIAQLADRAVPGGERAFPGTGDLNLHAFVTNLTAIGYQGPLSLEIFPPRPWDDPLAFARQAVAHLQSLIEAEPT